MAASGAKERLFAYPYRLASYLAGGHTQEGSTPASTQAGALASSNPASAVDQYAGVSNSGGKAAGTTAKGRVPAAGSGNIPANAQTIYNYLTSQGLSANAAAGILGNIQQESGGNPSAGVWPGNYGLIQWTPASNYFQSPPNLQAQLAGIMAYIKSNGSVADINKNATSPTAAALYFSTNYERPNAQLANNANRMASAAAVAAAAQSGNWPNSSSLTASSSPITRPGGGPTDSSTPSGPTVDDIFTNYNAEVNMDRTSPSGFVSTSRAGWTAPFQWWWQSFTSSYEAEQSEEQSSG